MSVLVTMKVRADTERFRRFLVAEPERLRIFALSAQAAGAIHHRFGIGDGFLVVIDEWESVESFESFMSRDEIAGILRDSGVQTVPEVEVTEVIESADQL